ncbi:MAG: FAD-dependent oxidoreductase [Cyanobacteria bacterium]|nr:FAD-dependent oxidoreductase [Cyanobacteriota bacterium]
MKQTVAIVGAGLVGRLLALELYQTDCWDICLFDQDDQKGSQSCSFVGAGMLSPWSELATAEPLITQLGITSLMLWPQILQQLTSPIFFQKAGTLIVSHRQDYTELAQFTGLLQAKIQQYFPELTKTKSLSIQWQLLAKEIESLEPELWGSFHRGILIEEEGQIDNRQLLQGLAEDILKKNIAWQTDTVINYIDSSTINGTHFDWVIDCRGLGAKPDWPELRGVRGEIIRVFAPEVHLTRPIRLMHPRYPLYIAPRENHHYLIGATSIESEDNSPVTVRSAIELLSAAYSLHSGFAEASILEMQTHCRPALKDHLPKIQIQGNIIRVNGLYRHGFLVTPALVKMLSQWLTQPDSFNDLHPNFKTLFEFKEEAVYAGRR